MEKKDSSRFIIIIIIIILTYQTNPLMAKQQKHSWGR